jgi:hypothetical protein
MKNLPNSAIQWEAWSGVQKLKEKRLYQFADKKIICRFLEKLQFF